MVNGNKKTERLLYMRGQISAEGRFILLGLFIVYILGEKQKIRKIYLDMNLSQRSKLGFATNSSDKN